MHGGSRRWIMLEVENSLKRLGTDYIDLYQIHRPDDHADIDETLGALSDLVHQGKIRYLGHSTFPAEYIVEAQWVSERRGRERFVCEQPPYSIVVRGIERAVLPTCRALRHRRDPLEPARRRPAHRPLPEGSARTGRIEAVPRLRLAAPEPAPAARARGAPRRGGRAPEGRERGGREPHAPGTRVRARAPARDVGHHRAAHDGAARGRARGCRRCASTRRPSTRSTRSCRPAPTSAAATRGSRPASPRSTAAAKASWSHGRQGREVDEAELHRAGEAAVGDEVETVDVRGLVAVEEDQRSRHLVGASHAADLIGRPVEQR